MPDPVIPDPPPGWEKVLQAAKELVIVIGAVAGAIFAGIGQCQGKKNNEDIQTVTAKVDATAQKVDSTETKVDAAKVVATKTAQKVGAINGDK